MSPADGSPAQRTALITGAGRGIGRAVAESLHAQGWSLILVSRGREALEETAASLAVEQYSSQRLVLGAVDVQDGRELGRFVAQAEQTAGPVDLLFNNAAVNFPGTCDLAEEHFLEMLRVNVLGCRNAAAAVVEGMKGRRRGYIINMSSIAGRHGFAGAGGYCASKFAVSGLSEALFHELLPFGIKVTAIYPSWVDTAMAQHAPFGGQLMIRPEDIALTVRYLLSLSPQACPAEIVIQCAADPV